MPTPRPWGQAQLHRCPWSKCDNKDKPGPFGPICDRPPRRARSNSCRHRPGALQTKRYMWGAGWGFVANVNTTLPFWNSGDESWYYQKLESDNSQLQDVFLPLSTQQCAEYKAHQVMPLGIYSVRHLHVRDAANLLPPRGSRRYGEPLNLQSRPVLYGNATIGFPCDFAFLVNVVELADKYVLSWNNKTQHTKHKMNNRSWYVQQQRASRA